MDHNLLNPYERLTYDLITENLSSLNSGNIIVTIKPQTASVPFSRVYIKSPATPFRGDTGDVLFARISPIFGSDSEFELLINRSAYITNWLRAEDQLFPTSDNGEILISEAFLRTPTGKRFLNYVLPRFFKSDAFGCCSRFKECSLEHQCVHSDPVYSTACQYRANLENGKIFY